MAINKRPVIGVTGPKKGGLFPWIMTWFALRRAGGSATRITVESPKAATHLDGLVIGGGSDIYPENYGQQLLELQREEQARRLRDKLLGVTLFLLRLVFSIKTSQPRQDVERDRLEMELCRYAIENELPVLGICRGSQLINITLGGTLHQDISAFYTETPSVRSILPRKKIRLTEKSRLREIFEVDTCQVNSLHRQAVNKLGSGLVVSAIEDSNVIQGIENTTHPFMIGVQWHPEYLPQIERQQRLFKTLVESSRKRRNSNEPVTTQPSV